MSAMMTIGELEEAYEHSRDRLLRGELDEEEFKAEIEKLRYEDDQGRQWKVGWYTGKWYHYDQGQWLQGTPLERDPGHELARSPQLSRMPGEDRPGRPLAMGLATALIVLLLLASAVLVLGWNTDWWRQSRSSPSLAAATLSVVSPTASHEPVASPLPPAPTRVIATPGPTATATHRPRPTPTTTVEASPSPAPSLSPSVTPSSTPSGTAAPAIVAPKPTSAPALSGQIFFPVFDPNPDRRTFDIYAVRLPGGSRDRIVGQASQPALSPDGQRLAFRSWDAAQRGLMVRELLDGNTWLWVNYGEAARPAWTPDNQNIVFPSKQESDRAWRLYRTLGLEFDRVRRHGGDILGRVPICLAGGQIVYWECPEDKCGLYIMKNDGTAPRRLTTAEHDTAPAASPDGTQVAFMSNRGGNWEIYALPITNPEAAPEQEIRRLTDSPARDGLPVWSPDGRWLAFVTDREGLWAVWAMRPDGAGQHKLFDLGGPLEGKIGNVTDEDQGDWTWESLAWGP